MRLRGLALITKAVPSPLVTIVLLTGVCVYLGLDIRTMVVGLLVSLMTAARADQLADTRRYKNRECVCKGVVHIANDFIGSMAGCAMIDQPVINMKSGGRRRLSTLVAGVVLLILVAFLGDGVKQIPIAALVAVMIMVSIGTSTGARSGTCGSTRRVQALSCWPRRP